MHDRNGQPLNVGDRVLIPGVITRAQTGTDFCNITVETDEKMFPGEYKSEISLNAKQVEKVAA